MVIRCIILFGCSVLLAASATEIGSPESLLSHWSAFKVQHGKKYASAAEEAKRFEIFARNKLEIERFNAEESNKAGYMQALSRFSDLTLDELFVRDARDRSRSSSDRVDYEFLAGLLVDDGEPPPKEVDWRKEGRVSRVKTEGACESAWAFVTAGVLEGQEKARKNVSNLIELSSQQLIDCSKTNNCFLGDLPGGFEDVVQQGGLMPSEDYPYTAWRSTKCKLNQSKIVFSPKNYTLLKPENDELNLQKVLARYGPVAVRLDSFRLSFWHYSGGVYSDKDCGSIGATGKALVVGYGTDPRDGDYWTVKLNWGKYWGEDGYMRLKRGNNLCLIASKPIIFTF